LNDLASFFDDAHKQHHSYLKFYTGSDG
jgi:hypothetical protein